MVDAMQAGALSRGWSGLVLAYGAVQGPMLAGLIQGRAQFRKLLLSPVVAAPLTAVTGIGVAATAPLLHYLGAASEGVLQFSVGVGLSVALGYVSGRAIASRTSSGSAHQRGTIITDAAAIADERQAGRTRSAGRARALLARDRDKAITLGGLAVMPEDETKHFKLIGTTGTGKSTAIRELLGGALGRGDGAVVADPDGGYVKRFHDPRRGDVILNPFDAASVKWDLFGEITNAYDVDQLARSLIPDHEGSDRSWRGYARTFFSAVTRQAHAAGIADVKELYRLLVTAGTTELKTLVAGTPAQPFLEEHNGRMFDSIRSVTSSAVGALDYIAQQQAPPFSVRKWVQGRSLGRTASKQGGAGQTSTGVLFLPYRAGQIAALRSMISAWMRLAIFEAMSQEEGDLPLWFVVDELDALGQIDGLKDALARLRKFGGRCVLGFQSIAQVSSTYGSGEAQTIVENCGNTLILRCSGSEHGGTSQFASRLIGQREVIRTTRSRSRRATELLPSITRSEHFSIEPAVMGSEIEQLADLTGYLKFASQPEWIRIGLPAAGERERTKIARIGGDAGMMLGRPHTSQRERARAAVTADDSARQTSVSRDDFDHE